MKRVGSVLLMDINNRKIRTAVISADKHSTFDILHIGEYDSGGFNSGAVSDLSNAVKSVKSAITSTLDEAGLKKTPEIWVGHSGSHVRSDNIAEIDTLTSNRVVTDRQENRIKLRVSKQVPAGHYPLHSFLRSSSLDGITTRSAVGLTGNRLVTRFHLVYTRIAVINNLKQVFQKAGFNVNRFVFSGYSSSLSVIDNDERVMGCLVLNIGHTTCDYIVYQEGRPFLCGSLNEGWSRLVKDVAVGVQINIDRAEALMQSEGSASDILVGEDSPLSVKTFFGEQSRLTRRHLAKIMGCAVEEMFGTIRDNLKGSVCRGHLPAGIVLTGKGATLNGMTYCAEKVFGVMARVGDPVFPGKNRSFSPVWSNLSGLVVHAFSEYHPTVRPETLQECIVYAAQSAWNHMFPSAKDPREPEGEATI